MYLNNFINDNITKELMGFLENIQIQRREHYEKAIYDYNVINSQKDKFAYFMLKPDSQKNIVEILEYLENSNIGEYNIFYTKEWGNIAYELYEAYNEKTPNFSRIFKSFVFTVNEIFSNVALIFVVKSNEEYEKLIKKIFNFKLFIRKKVKKFSYAIFTNTDTIEEIYTNDLPEKNISVKVNNCEIENIYGFQKVGKYDIHVPNIIHSPDPIIYNVLRELKILEGFNVFDNQLNVKDLKNIIKLKSYSSL